MLFDVENLQVSLSLGGHSHRVVEGVGFTLGERKTLCLVGESGCGKSITALALMNLLPANARISQGRILLDGVELVKLPSNAWPHVRGKKLSMIFQEPGTSLNPLLTVGYQLREALTLHASMASKEATDRVLDIMHEVGIATPIERYGQYPHQLSGGMKQRIMIAMALLCRPQLLIADEPTTALDVTIQAQILELIRAMQQKHGMAVLLISHDLGVVFEMADEIAVMYAGMIVEKGSRADIFERAKHPYTQALLRALRMEPIPGRVPRLSEFSDHCRFVDRCPIATEACRQTMPTLEKKTATHAVRCMHA